ncbi:MAG TPA: DUF2783 domain-containing protein [Comamonas sp.]|uniref:DUF2783 domain-containing protein n=1 Tax=Comamonas halotolerans TaxID=3041496 RepID=UPI0024E17783|nr:DUF2783 domain-containing protein [Comamonas sp. NoAH]
MTRNPQAPDIATVEAMYDTLAQAIDQAGPEKTELFLLKLAFVQAHAIGHVAPLEQHIANALKDL